MLPPDTTVVGIDPGKSGAIAFLTAGVDPVIHDMPIFKDPKGKTVINLNELARLLIPVPGHRMIGILELVHSMRNDGAVQAFTFGRGYGALEMALMGHGYETHYVTPPTWKRHFKLSKDKGVSRSLATRRFPSVGDKFTRVKDDGRAEALLIALYGAEKIIRP